VRLLTSNKSGSSLAYRQEGPRKLVCPSSFSSKSPGRKYLGKIQKSNSSTSSGSNENENADGCWRTITDHKILSHQSTSTNNI